MQWNNVPSLCRQAQRTDREADLVETDAADVRADADGLRELTHMGVVSARGQHRHIYSPVDLKMYRNI